MNTVIYIKYNEDKEKSSHSYFHIDNSMNISCNITKILDNGAKITTMRINNMLNNNMQLSIDDLLRTFRKLDVYLCKKYQSIFDKHHPNNKISNLDFSQKFKTLKKAPLSQIDYILNQIYNKVREIRNIENHPTLENNNTNTLITRSNKQYSYENIINLNYALSILMDKDSDILNHYEKCYIYTIFINIFKYQPKDASELFRNPSNLLKISLSPNIMYHINLDEVKNITLDSKMTEYLELWPFNSYLQLIDNDELKKTMRDPNWQKKYLIKGKKLMIGPQIIELHGQSFHIAPELVNNFPDITFQQLLDSYS